MPRMIDQAFEELLAKLTPSTFESTAAASHRNSILTRLQQDFGSVRRFFRIGSFGNGTSISGYSDVDYLACLPTNQLGESSNYTLTKVRNALDNRFPSTGVRVSCPAVVCPFGNIRSETTEIVPADEIGMSPGNHFKVYDIPDCNNGWMKASPDAHNAFVALVDGRLDKKVKPLIRFFKALKYFQGIPISSFYLEMKIAEYAAKETSIFYDLDIRIFLQRLLDQSLPDLDDPMGISGKIKPCKSNANRDETLSKLITASSRAIKAYSAKERGDISEAFHWWDLFFGDKFPNYYY
ncbi:MAG: nucleotidyltransferase [Proteobacteria bacterium]|nr:MAG: nucleotidyltransferase [Pseudomonadota bacterium]